MDQYPLTDRAEIEECRRLTYQGTDGRGNYYFAVEEYDSAAELGAGRDLEEWGCDPFEEES